MSLHLQEIESLQNSLREREKYVTELENRLRALWDKLEGERKCNLEHLRLQEEHLSEIERENERLNNHIRQLERELNEANKTISLQHELMTTAEKRGVDKAKEELNEAKDRIKRLEAFVNRFLDPEDLGYAVNKCLRDDAREALGRSRVESPSKENKP